MCNEMAFHKGRKLGESNVMFLIYREGRVVNGRGHTVRFAVWLPLFSPALIGFSLSHCYVPFQVVMVFLFSPSFSPCPPLTLDSSFPLSTPSLFSSLHWPCLFFDLSLPLFVASLGILSGSPLLASHCPFFSFSSCSPLYSFLSFPLFLSPASSLSLKVFAQRGSAQRGSTLHSSHPKGVACRHVERFSRWRYDLLLSSCAFSMSRLRSWCLIPHTLCHSILLSLACLPATPLLLKVGHGVTSLWHTVRLVLLCPAIFLPLMHFITPPHGPLSSNSFFTPLIFVLFHTSSPALSNSTLYTLVLSLSKFSLLYLSVSCSTLNSLPSSFLHDTFWFLIRFLNNHPTLSLHHLLSVAARFA